MDGDVKFLICGDVKAPTRRDGQDAGVDLYVPNMTEDFIRELAKENPNQPYTWGLLPVPRVDKDNKPVGEDLMIYIAPNSDIKIPTYVKSRIPSNMCLRMSNKSGVCQKQKLLVGAEIVDPSYEGMIYLHLWNPSSCNRFIEFGQKIAQLVPLYINSDKISIQYEEKAPNIPAGANKISEEKFYEGLVSDRKDGAFGSTGTN